MTERAAQVLATVEHCAREYDETMRRAHASGWETAEAMWRANREERISERAMSVRVGWPQPRVSEFIRIWERHRDSLTPRSRVFAETLTKIKMLMAEVCGRGVGDQAEKWLRTRK